jgi:glycogen(starch) synthase
VDRQRRAGEGADPTEAGEPRRPLSVLCLTNMYPPHHLGGYELSCRDVMTRWADAGHSISVLTTTMRVEGVGQADDSEVARQLEFYWDDHVLLNPPLWRRLGIERRNHRVLVRALEDTRPDVVSVWNMGAMSLGLLSAVASRGIPMVLVVCDDWPVYGPRMDPWSRLFLGRASRLAGLTERISGVPCRLVDLDSVGPSCFVSEFTRERARAWTRWTFGLSDVVYSGIESADFLPETRQGPDRPPWQGRLLYVGRLDPRKGIETLLKAVPLMAAGTTLEVIGRGPDEYRQRLLSLCSELGIAQRVRFGSADREELAASYREADLLVFPSEWDEPFGLVPVEAMACGTPVLATRTGGSAEFLIEDHNCLAYRPGDTEELASQVAVMAADPGLRERLVEGGRATAAELTVDRLAQVLEAWHVAAAERFAGGMPAHRCLPGPQPRQ